MHHTDADIVLKVFCPCVAVVEDGFLDFDAAVFIVIHVFAGPVILSGIATGTVLLVKTSKLSGLIKRLDGLAAIVVKDDFETFVSVRVIFCPDRIPIILPRSSIDVVYHGVNGQLPRVISRQNHASIIKGLQFI